MSELTDVLEELRAIRRLLEKQTAPAQTTYTNKDAAKRIGISPSTFALMIQRDEVRRVKVLGKWRVPESEIQRLSTPAPAPAARAGGRRRAPLAEPMPSAQEMFERGMKRLKGRGR
jgi:hypothetical protein